MALGFQSKQTHLVTRDSRPLFQRSTGLHSNDGRTAKRTKRSHWVCRLQCSAAPALHRPSSGAGAAASPHRLSRATPTQASGAYRRWRTLASDRLELWSTGACVVCARMNEESERGWCKRAHQQLRAAAAASTYQPAYPVKTTTLTDTTTGAAVGRFHTSQQLLPPRGRWWCAGPGARAAAAPNRGRHASDRSKRHQPPAPPAECGWRWRQPAARCSAGAAAGRAWRRGCCSCSALVPGWWWRPAGGCG